MTVDYTRRAPKRRAGPVPAPVPEPAPERQGRAWVPMTWRLVLAGIALNVLSNGAPVLGVLVLAVAVLPLRWMMAYAGLAGIRWWVVRKTRPYAHLLEAPGPVTDPRAPWRQWLDTRCGTCGS